MTFKDFHIESIARYFLVGLNFTVFNGILPLIIASYPNILETIASISSIGVIGISIAISYLFDILKVYRFTPKYTSKRNKFMEDIARLLDIENRYASTYFSIISEMSDFEKKYRLKKRHYDWILISTTSLSFASASIIYLCMIFSYLYMCNYGIAFFASSFMFIFSVLCFIRLNDIGKREREKSRNEFLLYINLNKAIIKDYIKLKESS